MKRISGHVVDPNHTKDLQPIPIRINFYVDGYGAMKSAMKLYDIGDMRLEEHLRSQDNPDGKQARLLYDQFYSPPSAAVLADILSYGLAILELFVISSIEDRLAEGGKPVLPNALLVNRSNPLSANVGGVSENLLEALYPIEGREYAAKYYADVTCEGVIYSTEKINRKRERDNLRRELERCANGDSSRAAWIKKNLESIESGAFHWRNKDGSIGSSIDFAFSETFFDKVSGRIGFSSREGESKVHWRNDLSDFGEKGVDCDLIMQVMDDLHDKKIDVFVFMTNDMDFFPLIKRLISEGKHVFLCGLEGDVSNKLIQTVGRDSFFNMLDEPITANLPTVFMAMQKPELRSMALQWAWLAIRREQKGRS